jgi:hypothetical protein
MSMSASYYIYYKVPSHAAALLRPTVQALQRALSGKTGVASKLLCRRDKADPALQTWMEVYEDVADTDGFEAALGAELERLRVADLLGPESARRTEVFRPL